MLSNLTEFGGKRVVDYLPGTPLDPGEYGYRIRVLDDGDDFESLVDRFVAEPNADQVEVLTIGHWDAYSGDPGDIAAQYVTRQASKLPDVRALMFGDISQEESELSWIVSTDLGPLISAFPRLEQFRCRGGDSLAFTSVEAPNLRELTIETTGLPRGVVSQLAAAASSIPRLEKLELWIGDTMYLDATTDALELSAIFYDNLFPRLRHLGLCNSMNASELVAYMCGAPSVSRDDLAGKTVVVAGSSWRDDLHDALHEMGAETRDSFTLRADYLFAGRDASGVLEALYFGVPVLFEPDVDALLDRGATDRAPAPLVDQLTSLDLSGSAVGDETFDLLQQHPGIEGLQRITATDHYASEGWEDVFAGRGLETDFSAQWASGPTDRYVSVSE